MIRDLIANRKNWDGIAVIESEKNVSYRDLAQKALAIQKLLPSGQLENIAILLPNGSDYIAAFCAVIASGMTAFPLNASMTIHEILPLLVQASARVVITSSSLLPLFDNLTEPEILRPTVICIDRLHIGGQTALPVAVTVGQDDPMVLLATSGTTGRSKIVQLSERNVKTSVLGYIDKMAFGKTGTNDKRFILATPFCSAYGLMILSACLIKFFPIVPMKDNFTLGALYRTAQTHRVTHYEGGASTILMMEQMAGRPIPYDISLLRCFGFGGSKVSSDTIKTLLSAYPGIELLQGYGMTEASPLITKFHREEPIKPDSVGTAIKGVKIAIEADGIITDAPYIRGEIVVRGSNVMLGYYNNPAETDRVLKNGYLLTGDIGYLDQQGYLYICGRKKSIIIVRGLNVYPEEVEECILSSRLATDCRVYGQVDPSGAETVCADIVPVHPQITAEEVKSYCRSRLAGYKQPQIIRILTEIAKNASGKIARMEEERP